MSALSYPVTVPANTDGWLQLDEQQFTATLGSQRNRMSYQNAIELLAALAGSSIGNAHGRISQLQHWVEVNYRQQAQTFEQEVNRLGNDARRYIEEGRALDTARVDAQVERLDKLIAALERGNSEATSAMI